MSVQQLNEALLDYKEKLQTIEKAVNKDNSFPSKEQIFALLTSRDIIRVLLIDCKEKLNNPELLVDLDSRLEKISYTINKVVDLPQARKSFHPTRKAWWWWLSMANVNPINWWDKYDKVWNFLSVLFLGISLILMFFVSTGFLSGERDAIAAIVVTLQTSFVTIVGGSIFTEEGRKIVDKIFTNIGIPVHFRQESRLIASFCLCLILLLTYISLPKVSVFYNNKGLIYYEQEALISAQKNYERAIALNEDYAEARYNLGLVFEDLSQEELAIKQYSIAGRLGSLKANNNLARLYIRSDTDKIDKAVYLLLEGLGNINTIKNSHSDSEWTQLEYSLLKNLGWARLKQKRYGEAKAVLQEAIDLDKKSASAYCLLGQAMEKEIESKLESASLLNYPQIVTMFENCIKLANPRGDIDEDKWLGIAQKKIKPYINQSNN